jgi:asparagine synthase (glutamine-hydrolysing)
MCGIVGALTFDGGAFQVTEPYIVRMRDAMAHRGPDGAGTWIAPDRRTGLGHRRLAIIDLSAAANQPMSNEDGSLWVVFNGEIYNHAEIRAELESLGGHRWKTDHSDTEVILHAFEEWGIECIHKFRGMFAIALWDDRRKALWLIRDRIGVKPLYYSIHHGRVVFASEIKALLQDPDQKRAVNEESLFHYLSFITSPAPHTLFDGISKLPAGSWLRVDRAGRVDERRWWDVWDHTTPLENTSEEEVAERLLSELRTSVQYRNVSDVPVGVFLSGGIDSSTNAALFSEGRSEPVKTFTIGYRGEYESCSNEFEHARKMAHIIGADHHERSLTLDDLLRFLPAMIRLQDEPIADPVCVPLYYVSQLARQHGVIVCQVGEGSDELFCGYGHWKRGLQLQRFNDLPVPRLLKSAGLTSLRWAGYGETRYTELLRRAVNRQTVFWGGVDLLNQAQKQYLFSPRMRRRFEGITSWEALRPIRDRFEEKAWEPSHVNWMSYVDLNVRLPEMLLMRVDKMSMGVGLEARVPFLDHAFVSLAMSVPGRMKTRGGRLKHILKRAVRGLIPDEVIDRKKQGFSVPVQEWMLTRLGAAARETLSAFCRETDFFDFAAVESLLDRRDANHVWTLLNLALWWNHYVKEDDSHSFPHYYTIEDETAAALLAA